MGVFADLKSNPLAVMEMARAGVKVDVIRNGHSQIKQSLYDDPARFGAVEESAHFYEAFYDEARNRYCTENSLYITLLAARVWRRAPERFARLLDIQRQTSREREWGYKFPTDRRCRGARGGARAFESVGAIDGADAKRHGPRGDADAAGAAAGHRREHVSGAGLAPGLPAHLS